MIPLRTSLTATTTPAPEVLSPAGDRERLDMAVAYGADAVYLALKSFGMRAFAGNFTPDELSDAVAYCHRKGVRVYVTLNTVMHGRDLALLPESFEAVSSAGADAVIVSDLGALALAKKYAPRAEIHVSTQTGVANAEAAKVLYDLGAKRIITAREMTLAEIAEMRKSCPKELEIEVFVHGSMCVSFSGRCLLSNFMTGRDGNGGKCAQPCRWKYSLVEETRPGQYFEITEDGGTYILNSRDLCMIEHIPELIDAGVTSFKIEGRMKSAYYTAVVTNAYRHAVDFAVRGEPLPQVWKNEVNKVSHREYSTGFFFSSDGPGQSYDKKIYRTECDVAAVVESCDFSGLARLTQRNKFSEGDTLTLLTPESEPVSFTAHGMKSPEGEPHSVLPHPMMEFTMPLPMPAPRLSVIRREKS
ncbi:MAG: U32 family peptidase [Lachnospiraceae bacterium]|nr:U32 family peptidase [Lachnospiraceae bacterium]